MSSRIPRIIFFGLIAITLFSEMIFSNIGTLTGDIAGTAQMLGLSVEAERQRLLILIMLDAIGGIGAVIAIVGAATGRLNVLRAGGTMCAIGLVAYGLYQLIAAFTQLGPELRAPIMLVGVLYMLIGVMAWLLSRAGVRTPPRKPAATDYIEPAD
jgi:hypothetical protein